MVPLRAASMEKGSAGLLCAEKEGGSMRRKGELEARRLERAPMRLCFGEPRLWLMGVEVVVFGEERALRTDGMEGEAVSGSLVLSGEGTMANFDGLENPSVVFGFLVGELTLEGSTFSASSSSKMAGPRLRFPVDAVGLGLSGEANGEIESGVKAGGHAFSGWEVGRSGRLLTILPVLCALEGVEARGAQLGEGLARRESHCGEAGMSRGHSWWSTKGTGECVQQHGGIRGRRGELGGKTDGRRGSEYSWLAVGTRSTSAFCADRQGRPCSRPGGTFPLAMLHCGRLHWMCAPAPEHARTTNAELPTRLHTRMLVARFSTRCPQLRAAYVDGWEPAVRGRPRRFIAPEHLPRRGCALGT